MSTAKKPATERLEAGELGLPTSFAGPAPLIEQAIANARAGQPWVQVVDIPDRFACNLELCVARAELLADLNASVDLPLDLVARYNALNDAIHHGDAHRGQS